MKFLRSSFREILALAAVVAGVLYLFLAGHPPRREVVSVPKVPAASGALGQDAPLAQNVSSEVAAVAATLPVDEAVPPSVDLKFSPGATTAEQQVAAASDAKFSPGERARALFALLPSLPEESLDEAVRRAIEGLPDADYAAVALPVVTNPQTHGRILSVLFTDLMQRPDQIALPALLDIARNPMHPLANAAQDNLSLLVGENLGHDWPRWEQRLHRLLAGKQVP